MNRSPETVEGVEAFRRFREAVKAALTVHKSTVVQYERRTEKPKRKKPSPKT